MCDVDNSNFFLKDDCDLHGQCPISKLPCCWCSCEDCVEATPGVTCYHPHEQSHYQVEEDLSDHV